MSGHSGGPKGGQETEEVEKMNKLDVAIALIEDAKKQVNRPECNEVEFQKYQDDLKLARRMILDMYTVTNGTVDYIAQGRVYKELSGHEIE